MVNYNFQVRRLKLTRKLPITGYTHINRTGGLVSWPRVCLCVNLCFSLNTSRIEDMQATQVCFPLLPHHHLDGQHRRRHHPLSFCLSSFFLRVLHFHSLIIITCCCHNVVLSKDTTSSRRTFSLSFSRVTLELCPVTGHHKRTIKTAAAT